jgi:hypothetical protein
MKRAYGVFLILVAIYFFWTSTPRQQSVPVPPKIVPEPKVADSHSGPGL